MSEHLFVRDYHLELMCQEQLFQGTNLSGSWPFEGVLKEFATSVLEIVLCEFLKLALGLLK